jgi:hypothetical protein
MAAAAEINDRYHSTLQAHFGVELG